MSNSIDNEKYKVNETSNISITLFVHHLPDIIFQERRLALRFPCVDVPTKMHSIALNIFLLKIL